MYSQSNNKQTKNPLTAHLSSPFNFLQQPFVSFPPSHDGDHLLIKDRLLSLSFSLSHTHTHTLTHWCFIVFCGVHMHALQKCHFLMPNSALFPLSIFFVWQLQIWLGISLLREIKGRPLLFIYIIAIYHGHSSSSPHHHKSSLIIIINPA